MPSLKSHDVAVALQLALTPGLPFRELSAAVGLSLGEAHNAVQRLRSSRLLRADSGEVNRGALIEFLSAGVPYAFFAEPGPETRGVPTAHSAPPLVREFSDGQVVVWPSLTGETRGASLEPLYPGAPQTANHNRDLYELLTLVDAIRVGRARERQRARALVRERLSTGKNPDVDS